jgi:hypothetical protein
MADPRYPKEFTCPLIANYAMETELGINRTEFINGQFRNRKRYSGEVTVVNLDFALPFQSMFYWMRWVNQNAYTWFLMDLYSMHSAVENGRMLPHRLRFISDIKGSTYNERWAKASVDAEFDPNYDVKLLPEFTGVWIIAGDPPAPSAPDIVIPGTVPAPSINVVNPGTPQFPAA